MSYENKTAPAPSPTDASADAGMVEAEFDQFADEYASLHSKNIRLSGEEPDYFAAYKVADVRGELDRDGSSPATIVDLGAGVGNSVPHFLRYFPGTRLMCLDVSERSLAIARQRFGRDAEYIHFSGLELPLPDASVDVAFSACVFHHIDPTVHLAYIRELKRILRPGGRLFIFEHNPLNPLTVHAVNTCPFDKNARLIPASRMASLFHSAGLTNIRTRFRIFFPRLLSGARCLEPYLKWCPLGAQYYIAARKGEAG